MAAEVAASAESGQLVLFHHDPAYSDEFVAAQEASAKNIFPDSRAAFEGMEIDLPLTPSPARRREIKDVKYVKNG